MTFLINHAKNTGTWLVCCTKSSSKIFIFLLSLLIDDDLAVSVNITDKISLKSDFFSHDFVKMSSLYPLKLLFFKITGMPLWLHSLVLKKTGSSICSTIQYNLFKNIYHNGTYEGARTQGFKVLFIKWLKQYWKWHGHVTQHSFMQLLSNSRLMHIT